MQIITISGVDGSGKSTQVDLLKESFESHDGKIYYFHSVLFSLANKKGSQKPGTAKAVTKASWYKIQLRKFVLLIDLLRFERLLATLKKDGYTHLVSDRYFYDSLINILYLSEGKKYTSFGVMFLERLVKQPDFAFFLSVSPEEICRRERDIEQGTDYLVKKNELFHSITTPWQITMIDGERQQDTIAHDILSRVSH